MYEMGMRAHVIGWTADVGDLLVRRISLCSAMYRRVEGVCAV